MILAILEIKSLCGRIDVRGEIRVEWRGASRSQCIDDTRNI
jgi:hypothetical protein